ncbi:MAG TPA: hypothetical protein VFG20_15805 [Planctomycetaceae bacterium]|nr:hypothetical protein [Planctomycetaceae bacterium]
MSWLARLLAWDGVLPLFVWTIPAVLDRVVPHERAMVMLSAILLPVAAVVIRFYVGKAMIDTNRCTPRFRIVQLTCLCIGLLVLMCLDSLLITLFSLDLPGDPLDELVAALGVFAILYTPYLAFLAVAMYPGANAETEPDERLARTLV